MGPYRPQAVGERGPSAFLGCELPAPWPSVNETRQDCFGRGQPGSAATPSRATMLRVTTPPTGNREFRGEVIRLAELTVTTNVLNGLTFINCSVVGPGVLVPVANVSFQHCSWGSPDLQAIFWLIEPGRTFVVGGIGVQDCTFSACRFDQVGVAGDEGLRKILSQGVS